MAAPKGNNFNPGGRPKGTPNKRTLEAAAIAERLKVDPFEILLYFATNDWRKLGYKAGEITKGSGDITWEEPVISPELRAKSAQGACEYLYPKRKALEHSITPETVSHIERTVITKVV